MKYSAEILLEDELSKVYYLALLPEKPIRTDRCQVKVSLEGNTLKFNFEATDFTALRAALHSYLRWLKVVEDTISVWRERK